MDKKIETILNELCSLDPALKSHEGNLRVLVTQLISAKPDSNIDKNFVSELRHKLLEKANMVNVQTPRILETPSYKSFEWMFRLVPVGVVSVLILLVASQWNVSSPENSVNMSQQVAENSLNITEQNPGKEVVVDFVNLKKNGYVAIHEDSNGSLGNIIGVSLLLETGRTEDVRIKLSRITDEGEVFYAALYEDDGDGLFSVINDKAVLDQILNMPMYMLFTISSNAATEGISQ